jgi:hypothetical protein
LRTASGLLSGGIRHDFSATSTISDLVRTYLEVVVTSGISHRTQLIAPIAPGSSARRRHPFPRRPHHFHRQNLHGRKQRAPGEFSATGSPCSFTKGISPSSPSSKLGLVVIAVATHDRCGCCDHCYNRRSFDNCARAHLSRTRQMRALSPVVTVPATVAARVDSFLCSARLLVRSLPASA